MRRLPLLFLLFLSVPGVFAQGYRGRDFWICFPENAVIEGNKSLQLSLFITAEARTVGTITNTMDSSVQNFSVDQGSSIERNIDTEIEIRSSGVTERKSLHITSDHDISLYVVSHRPASTDSYMAIPADLLGTEYFVAGYSLLRNGPASFPSQATMVATEDHTLVTVHLTAATRNGFAKGRTLTLSLNRGETYQLQGSNTAATNDLTGSSVTSNKPIAFFTGHQCAQVPPDKSFCDMLLEMEPPENDWGREFIATKFEGKDYYILRIIASAEATEVFIDGNSVVHLNAGEFYETRLGRDAVIAASKPALVAQYSTSTNADSIKIGDPFMLFLVPNDRFVSEVTTNTVVSGSWRHYLNVVVPETGFASLRIDGRKIPSSFATKIMTRPESKRRNQPMDVVTYEVAPGRHAVKCRVPVAVYSYGFGVRTDAYDSYGHACGMRLDK